MTIHIFEDSFVPKLFSLFIKVEAITIGPLIFCRGRATPRLIRHESIHVAQYRELYYLGFLCLYFWFWLKGLCVHKSFKLAYLDIPFEQEARFGEDAPNYLAERHVGAWKLWLGPNPPGSW